MRVSRRATRAAGLLRTLAIAVLFVALPRLALAQTAVPSAGLNALQSYTWYGADPTGVADAGPPLTTAINASPGTFVTMRLAPGTWNVETNTHSNTKIANWLIDGGAVVSGIAGGIDNYRVDWTAGIRHMNVCDSQGRNSFSYSLLLPSVIPTQGIIDNESCVNDNNNTGSQHLQQYISRNGYSSGSIYDFQNDWVGNWTAGPLDGVAEGIMQFNAYYPIISEANYYLSGNGNNQGSAPEMGEWDYIVQSPEVGFTALPGQGAAGNGLTLGPQTTGGNGFVGGLTLVGTDGVFDWESVRSGTQSGQTAGIGPNNLCPGYPCLLSKWNPSGVTSGNTLVITVSSVAYTATVGGAGAPADVAGAIMTANSGGAIPGVLAGVNTVGTQDKRLMIWSTTANDLGSLQIANGTGTPLATLGITAGTYSGSDVRSTGNLQAAVQVQSALHGNVVSPASTTTLTVVVSNLGGSPITTNYLFSPSSNIATMVAAINSIAPTGFKASAGGGTPAGGGALPVMVLSYLDPANVSSSPKQYITISGSSTSSLLTALGIKAGTYYNSTPPHTPAIAWSWNDSMGSGVDTPCGGNASCGVTITPVSVLGVAGTPVNVTTSTNTLAALVAAINTAAITGTNTTIVASTVGSTGNEWMNITNTAGGGFTLADYLGTPLEQMYMPAGTYVAGPTLVGAKTPFACANDTVAKNGVCFMAIGSSVVAQGAPYLPRNPFAASGQWYDGIDLANASFHSGNAIRLGASQGIAWAGGTVVTPNGSGANQGLNFVPTGTGQVAINGNPIQQYLLGATSSLGGSELAAGACSSTTATITGAIAGMAVVAEPLSDPGVGSYWQAFVSSANTVTVRVCATVAVTPAASVYYVHLLPSL